MTSRAGIHDELSGVAPKEHDLAMDTPCLRTRIDTREVVSQTR